MKKLFCIAVLAAVFAGCKKECGYITVKVGNEKRIFRYNDSVITGSPNTEYRLTFDDTKIYWFPDYPINLNDSDTANIKDCGEITL